MKDKGFYRKVYLCKIILMFMPGFTSTREKGPLPQREIDTLLV